MLTQAPQTARYRQIANGIREKIASGHYVPGNQLPTEKVFAEYFQVNRHTIREALKQLKNSGLVFGIQGRGHFVATDKIVYEASKKVRFSKKILESELTPGARLLSATRVKADQLLRSKLGLKPEAPVLALDILRFINGLPFSFSTSYLPANRFMDIEKHITEPFSLYDILEKHYQVEPVRHESVFEVLMPGRREMELLRTSHINPLLVVKSVAKDQSGQGVEYVISRIRGDIGSVAVNFFDR